VDYGEEHSRACRHSRFGRVYELGALPDVGRGAPGALRRPLRRRAGHPPPAADAPRKGVPGARRHLRELGAERPLPLGRAQRQHARLPRWNAVNVPAPRALISPLCFQNQTKRQTADDYALARPEDGRSLRPVCLLQVCRVGSILIPAPLARHPLAQALLRLRLRPLRHVASPRRRPGPRGPAAVARRGTVRHGGLDPCRT
jgi:hypothetical protein